MTALETAKFLRDKHGCSCIPVGNGEGGKGATIPWKEFQSRLPTDSELEEWFAFNSEIALIAGNVICIDFDGKEAQINYRKYIELCNEFELGDITKKLLVQHTQHGGIHLIFKTEPGLRNAKLANYSNGEVMIETRASGGYFLIAPSHNYTLESDWTQLQYIGGHERDALLEVAKAFEQKAKNALITTQGIDLKPGEDYNNKADISILLRQHGWKSSDGEHWIRPGKSRGLSATWNHVPNKFYVFTSSTEFEQFKAYSPFAVYAILECGGDYSLASSQLSKLGYGTKRNPAISKLEEKHAKQQEQLAEIIDDLPPIRPYWEDDKDPEFTSMPEELIKGMLHRRSKMIVSAPSKARKSWLMLDLALSIAGGASWLGYETTQTPVLFIDFELQAPMYRNRRAQIMEAKYSKKQVIPFYELLLRGKDVNPQKLEAHISSKVKELGIGFIVFDPIYKIESFDECKAQEVSNLLKWFEKLCSKLNVSIAFSHHYAKGNASAKESIDRASGSGVWARDPDALLMLTSHEENDVFVLESHLRNFPPQPPICIKWETPLWQRTLDYDTDDLKGKASKKEKRKTFSVVDLANLLNARGEKSVSSKNLNELAAIAGVSPGTIQRRWQTLKTTLNNNENEE